MADMYSDFLAAGKSIANVLGLANVKFKSERYETPNQGVDYLTDGSTESIRFNFHLRTESKKSDYSKWTSLSLHVYFYNDFGLCQFDKHGKFRYPVMVDIKQWASEVAKEYIEKRSNDDLNFLFGDRDIRVRGLAGATNTTLIEFIINLKGYLDWGADKLLVYRFHHGEGDSEGFSYAFLVESRMMIYDYSFWCVFPAFVGLSGGTSYGGYKQVESLLRQTKQKMKVTIHDIRIAEDDFLEFLRKKNLNFLRLHEESESLERLFENAAVEAGETVSKGPSNVKKHSLSEIPGKLEKRVFIGGNYDNISVLREVAEMVSELGYQPILALEFDVPRAKIHDYDLLLLHNCKRSIFEVTLPNGHLMELERAKEYGVETLVVFQTRDESGTPPPNVSTMVLSLGLPTRGYRNFKDLRKIVREFLQKQCASK
jgi:hypothetical protein